MKRASLPIRMRGWFFSMPLMMRKAACRRRGLGHRVEALDRLRAARIVGDAGAGAGIADDVGGDAAGMHHREPYRACGHRSSCRRLSEKPRTANFAAAYAVWPGGAMMPKMLERLTMWASRWLRQMRQERARPVHHAPEIDVHQPVHLRLVDLVELAHQRDAGIVDDDVEAGMGRDRGLRERPRSASGSPTSTRCTVTFCGWPRAISAASACNPASSRSASARSQPRAASSSASARPMPLAAPVTAAAAPRIAVIDVSSMSGNGEYDTAVSASIAARCDVHPARLVGIMPLGIKKAGSRRRPLSMKMVAIRRNLRRAEGPPF